MVYYLKEHWCSNLLVFLLQIISAGLAVLQNVVLMKVFQGIIDLSMDTFILWMIISFALCGLSCACDAARSWSKSRTQMVMNNHFRSDIVASILKKDYQQYHAQDSGEYLSWLINDVNQAAVLAWDSFYGIISVSAQVVFSIIVLTYMHWSLLAASVLVAVVILNAPKIFNKKIKKLSQNCAQEQAQATSKLTDLLSGLDVLRSFHKTARFIDGNKHASEQLEYPSHKLAWVQSFINQGVEIIGAVCQTLILLLVGFLSINGFIIQSALAGCANLCSTVYSGLSTISQLRVAIQASTPYFEKVVHKAGNASKNTSSDPAFTIENAISVDNLSFSYDQHPVLRNVSFDFKRGGKYALIGPSGCGKSTLLKLLLGWLPGYTGTINFDGEDARIFTSEQIQNQISYISQDVFLFNTTIRDNITLGEDFTNAQLAQVIKNSALEHDIKNMPLGLDTPVGENGNNLSGGQKQRIAIARALIHNRSILLVDEGTSSLDQRNADIVEQCLLKNASLTLILVSHHLSCERKAQFTKVYELKSIANSASHSESIT